MKRLCLLALALVVPLAGALAAPHMTVACTLDGRPTAFANGRRAVRTGPFSVKTPARVSSAQTWAPFSFPLSYHARAALRFTEDRAQLRRVLPADSMQRAWRWEFGDGVRAVGWTVTHRYTRPGTYRITVSAYVPSYGSYLLFDVVRIVIAH
jgi:hypothetical protein